MKCTIFNYIKNIPGKKTNRKIVVFSVDDYGNIRLDSKQARAALDRAGLKIYNRFDAFDTLETKQDITQLVDVLESVKDVNGRNAIFSSFAMSCNIDFDKMSQNNFMEYAYENVDKSFSKLSALQPEAYDGAWELMQKAIAEGLIQPQYHGREHLNLKVFNEKLARRDKDLIINLENRSYTSIFDSGYSSITTSSAFNFWDIDENNNLIQIAQDGIKRFADVYGYYPKHFNSPGSEESKIIHRCLSENGISYIDTPIIKKEHLGLGDYKKEFYYTGKKNFFNQYFMVRNCVFEPTEERGYDPVAYAFKQVEAAFALNNLAVISSHRVNFCGHIDPNNRRKGLEALKSLLSKIVSRWPDVEFMSAPQAMEILLKA